MQVAELRTSCCMGRRILESWKMSTSSFPVCHPTMYADGGEDEGDNGLLRQAPNGALYS